ncbi:hypothetical protein SESBI_20803 [Sesbania bispinosa]|nr:hypothetical protein SESBI_20803 [Sesbania bispinosa]
MITRSKTISKKDDGIGLKALKQDKPKSVLDLKRETIVKRKAKDPTPFVMLDWTKLYQRKIKEAALKAAPGTKPIPAEKPHKKIKVLFENLTEEDLEDVENPIIVPLKIVEPPTTSTEISQPVADDKVEEVTPPDEPAEKNKADEVAPTDHNKGKRLLNLLITPWRWNLLLMR